MQKFFFSTNQVQLSKPFFDFKSIFSTLFFLLLLKKSFVKLLFSSSIRSSDDELVKLSMDADISIRSGVLC